MKNTIRSLALVAAAFVGVNGLTPVYAVTIAPNPADFSVSESPGQYTVTNNSSSWYIYGFAVSNPDAATTGVAAFTDYKNWAGLSPNPSLDLNTGTASPAFAYASADADLTQIDNPTLSTVNPDDYIGPASFSDRFFFGTQKTASNFGLLVVTIVADLPVFATVNGVTSDVATTPLPATLPLFASAGGFLAFLSLRRKRTRVAVFMRSKIQAHVSLVLFAFGLAIGIGGASKASTVTDNTSFTDIGTYQVSGAGFYNGSAVASASFTITFDPTQLYLTQSIAGFISNLSYSVTDNRFTPANLTFNPITSFAFDGAGTLTLYSNPALNKTLDGTANITIGINGWAYTPASDVWYSQIGFADTLTTSGDVSIAQAATPLPAALPLFVSGLGGLGFLGWRRKRRLAAAA